MGAMVPAQNLRQASRWPEPSPAGLKSDGGTPNAEAISFGHVTDAAASISRLGRIGPYLLGLISA